MLHHIVHRDDLCFHTNRLNKIRHEKATPANKLPCANLCGTDIAYARNIFIRVLIHEFYMITSTITSCRVIQGGVHGASYPA
jgi:hypothetical protein